MFSKSTYFVTFCLAVLILPCYASDEPKKEFRNSAIFFALTSFLTIIAYCILYCCTRRCQKTTDGKQILNDLTEVRTGQTPYIGMLSTIHLTSNTQKPLIKMSCPNRLVKNNQDFVLVPKQMTEFQSLKECRLSIVD